MFRRKVTKIFFVSVSGFLASLATDKESNKTRGEDMKKLIISLFFVCAVFVFTSISYHFSLAQDAAEVSATAFDVKDKKFNDKRKEVKPKKEEIAIPGLVVAILESLISEFEKPESPYYTDTLGREIKLILIDAVYEIEALAQANIKTGEPMFHAP